MAERMQGGPEGTMPDRGPDRGHDCGLEHGLERGHQSVGPADVEQVDVMILGGGLAGSATALALLARGNRTVAIVDRPRRDAFRVGESATPDVSFLLGQLGISADLAALGHRPCHGTLSLWGGQKVFDDFLRKGKGHGWHLHRDSFDRWLSGEAVQRGARHWSPASLASLARTRDGRWLVQLDNGHALVARLVVDAGGRRSPLASCLGARRYQLDSLVALAVLGAPLSSARLTGQSVVEPFEHGWWYAAPLPDGRAMVTLMTDSDIVQQRSLGQVDGFRKAWRETRILQDLVALPSGDFHPEVFAAGSSFIDRAAGRGWLAVGDALTGFDPLTSSGMAGALSDAVAAAETLDAWLEGAALEDHGRRYGQRANATVSRYLQERRKVYGQEQRWAASPFWQRRIEGVTGEGRWLS